MSRVKRVDVGGMIYHALNRANFRSRLFRRGAPYQEFLVWLGEVGGTDCGNLRPGKYLAQSRTSETGTK